MVNDYEVHVIFQDTEHFKSFNLEANLKTNDKYNKKWAVICNLL